MSSDAIKDALVAAYPGTSEKDWKRRSKTKVAGGVERVFENGLTGAKVATIEAADGSISVEGSTGAIVAPKAAPVAPSTPPVVTATPKTVKAAPAASEGKVDRNKMVPKSTWVFTRDVDIYRWIVNRNGNYQKGRHVDNVMVQHVPAGTTFTVVGKFEAPGPVSDVMGKPVSNGYLIPIQFDPNPALTVVEGGGTHDPTPALVEVIDGGSYEAKPNGSWGLVGGTVVARKVPFNQIADAIAPLEIPETLVYVFRDTVTKEFWCGWHLEDHIRDGYNHGPYSTNKPKFGTKLSSAKKFKTTSAAKASIRDFTGYNAGLDEEGAWMPEYVASHGPAKMALPPTWEMVAFDKTTGEEKAVLDVQDWYKELMRLRTLTAGHGSAVRQAFKDAEGKEGIEAIVVFQNIHRGRAWRTNEPYQEGQDFTENPDEGKAAKAAIKEAVDGISGKYVRASSATMVAVACSLSDAFMARMRIEDGSDYWFETKVLDFKTLEEVVAA